jgi:hypothetical protein
MKSRGKHTERCASRGIESVPYGRLRYHGYLARRRVPASARLQAEGGRPPRAMSQVPLARRCGLKFFSVRARAAQGKEGQLPEIRRPTHRTMPRPRSPNPSPAGSSCHRRRGPSGGGGGMLGLDLNERKVVFHARRAHWAGQLFGLLGILPFRRDK